MSALDALLILAAVLFFLFTSLFAVGALIGLASLVKEALMAVRPSPVSKVAASVAPAAAKPAAPRSRAVRPEPIEIAPEISAAAAQA